MAALNAPAGPEPEPARNARPELAEADLSAYLESFLGAQRWRMVRRAIYPGGVPLLFVERQPPEEASPPGR